MPRLSQKLEQKQKLAPRQVLQARLLQLNTLNLEQAILKELELNPILEQVEPEDFEEKSMAEEILEEMDAPIEDVYTDESSYYIEQEKSDLPLPDRTTFIEKIIEQLQCLEPIGIFAKNLAFEFFNSKQKCKTLKQISKIFVNKLKKSKRLKLLK